MLSILSIVEASSLGIATAVTSMSGEVRAIGAAIFILSCVFLAIRLMATHRWDLVGEGLGVLAVCAGILVAAPTIAATMGLTAGAAGGLTGGIEIGDIFGLWLYWAPLLATLRRVWLR